MTTNPLTLSETPRPIHRPLDDEGLVLAALTRPVLPGVLVGHALPAVTNHLERACWWPRNAKNPAWQIGDFSFYILEFANADRARLFAQVWSEPGENVIFEVASGARNQPTEPPISYATKESLLNRGFEPGGAAGNFRKLVSIQRKEDCRRLARELIGVLTECLGYDAKSPLTYRLHLGQRTRATRVFDALTFDDFGRLLHACGFNAEPIEDSDRTAYRTSGTPQFVAVLKGESETHPGEFTGFVNSLYASLAPGVLQAVEQELRAELPFARVTIDSDGDLAVSQPVMVRGGVTETYLRHMLGFWRATIARVEKSIEKHADAADRRTFN
ncbi:MAG: YbjN domain-containing protein [Pseudomonadota bacterium]|nr:YbjN domain-containing protein [Pseudomonadota bacterium]